jgi:predicted porin
MKKTVFALAMLSAFAGGAAAAESSVTIYGIVDAGVVHEDKGAAASDAKPGGAKTSLNSGLQSGSRLGFKGSEDLGGGLSAIFTLENGFNVDDGTTTQSITVPATKTAPAQTQSRLFGRQAWVGLSGGFGALKLGRQNTPMRTAVESIDPFGIGMAGSLDKYFNDNGGGFRMDNAVNYMTPALGGFFAQAAYGFGETAGDTSASRQVGFSTGYADGPINALVAYHNINGDVATGGSNRTTLVGATYDFKVAKVNFGYEWSKADNLAGVTTGDARDLMIGGSVPFGASAVIGSYIRHKNQLASDGGYNHLAFGYTYSLSKRTNLYASLGRTSNDSASAKNVDLAGENYSVYMFGLRHKF